MLCALQCSASFPQKTILQDKLKPVLLCAHLDVVPAKEEDGWDVPPFEGRVQDEFIWGRGAIDDKHMVFAILEAAEHLLKREYRPKRTIYFGFGHDEEIGGVNGAQHVRFYWPFGDYTLL